MLMYNLIVSGNEGVWERRRYVLETSRLFEYTSEPLKTRYKSLGESLIEELISLPVLFAYERGLELPARVGRITRMFQSLGAIKFDFTIIDEIPPITPKQLEEIAWDLDIVNKWEMSRTHWAVKDIDLLDAFHHAGLIKMKQIPSELAMMYNSSSESREQLLINPTVFTVPKLERDLTLVSVMMPFSSEFDAIFEIIKSACKGIGLGCERADNVWEESTIIQDIFNLIFRSGIVVVDLTGQNSNVLYETGIAHTLGRPVVPISQTRNALPFDLVHHRILTYLPNDQGLAEMKVTLELRLRNLSKQLLTN